MKLTANIREFNAGLEKYRAAIKKKAEDIAKDTSLGLHSRIVALTPVDTGYARLGWRIEPNITGWVPPEGQDKYPVPETPSEIPTSTTYWIYNNVTYICSLEHGRSDRAPNGMVGLALTGVGQVLAEAARKNGWNR
ncbi:MAG: HK97 gp10 family phage protein [Deltaproteobacteria bacterium]|nr:HK97 gp10 family phage protein [Deltaproteobacteria bacterium]